MHSRETRVLLRHYLEQVVSKTELAKRFGISRRTVYHWIETGQLERDLDSQEARYRARPPEGTLAECVRAVEEPGPHCAAFPDDHTRKPVATSAATGTMVPGMDEKEIRLAAQITVRRAICKRFPAGLERTNSLLRLACIARRHK